MNRILVFTHDTFGLGHVQRCLHIVRALCGRLPGAAVLLVTGSPAARALRDLPPNADFVKLPTIVKTGASESQPSHLPLGLRAVTSLRQHLLRGAIEGFRPELVLVDNFPLGSRRELLPVLARARELGAKTVLGLRDIVDRPDVVRATWSREGIYEALRGLYDRVLVYGVPEILDAGPAYGLSPELQSRLRYCGYVTGAMRPVRRAADVRAELGAAGPLVVATVGGGGDGFPLLCSFVEAARSLPGVSALALTGPLMAPRERERVRALAGGERRIVVAEFVADLPSYLAAADAVVAMGGYNTVAELLALKRRALVLPRDWRYGEFAQGVGAGVEWEQPLRAEALERLGLLRVLARECFAPAALASRIAEALAHDARARVPDIDVDGAGRAAAALVELLQPEECHHVRP